MPSSIIIPIKLIEGQGPETRAKRMEFKIIRGKFKNNELTDYDTGEVIRCLTYGIVRERINGEEGFFHLKKDRWENKIIFQYILSPQDKEEIK